MSKELYVVTDPCYIIQDERLWNSLVDEMYKDDQLGSDTYPVTRELENITKCEAWSAQTGYGDWANRMEGDSVLGVNEEFCADSGMVCVCRYTNEVSRILLYNEIPSYCYALVEMDPETVRVTMDCSNHRWTVVTIEDNENKATSLPAE